MQEFTLKRSGRSPLAFTGELLAEATGAHGAPRRHDLRVYETDLGDYVAQVEYTTRWEGEISTSTVEVCEDEAAVEAFFVGYDPTASVMGYPPTGPQMADKQARLLRELRLRYEDQVSDLLSQQKIFAEPLQ